MFATFMTIAILGVSAQAAPQPFDCTGPVTQHMSARAILAKFGKDARREDVPGMAGRPVKGVVLYPDDPSRRLEVVFWDEAQNVVSSVTAGAGATGWSGPLGLHAGSALADVVAANGHDFAISGFDWDYGGYITNFRGGRLLKLDGGCAVQIRFALPAGIKAPEEIRGEKDLDSTISQVKAAAPRIDRLAIGWPLPAGVKASD